MFFYGDGFDDQNKLPCFSLWRWVVDGFLLGLIEVCVYLCRPKVVWPHFRDGFVYSSVWDLSLLIYCGRFTLLVLVYCAVCGGYVENVLCLLCFTLFRSRIWSLKKYTKRQTPHLFVNEREEKETLCESRSSNTRASTLHPTPATRCKMGLIWMGSITIGRWTLIKYEGYVMRMKIFNRDESWEI